MCLGLRTVFLFPNTIDYAIMYLVRGGDVIEAQGTMSLLFGKKRINSGIRGVREVTPLPLRFATVIKLSL